MKKKKFQKNEKIQESFEEYESWEWNAIEVLKSKKICAYKKILQDFQRAEISLKSTTIERIF